MGHVDVGSETETLVATSSDSESADDDSADTDAVDTDSESHPDQSMTYTLSHDETSTDSGSEGVNLEKGTDNIDTFLDGQGEEWEVVDEEKQRVAEDYLV